MKTKRDTTKEVSSIIYYNIINDVFQSYRVLEPSAGEGNLIDFISNRVQFNNPIDVIELNQEKADKLVDKGYNLIGRDYMNTNLENSYDLIIACPPFKDDANLEHIQKMYKDLDYLGIIITLCNTKWVYDNTPKAIKFRAFLQTVKYTITMLPDNSYIEKGKTVPTMVIKIKK